MTLPYVAPEFVGHDKDVVHFFCCHPDRSLCGIDITGEVLVEGDSSYTDDDCDLCVVLDQAGQGCGALLCSLRRAWRGHRDWRNRPGGDDR